MSASKAAESRRAYRLANAEKVKAQIADWRRRNPGKAREYAARRYAAHSAQLLARARAKREANPEPSRQATRRSKYKRIGVDPVLAEAARRNHDGKCACCGCSSPGGKGLWNVDHDHATGRIRGVLCFQCNIGIGKLGDTLEGVLRAVRYLTGPQGG